LLLTEPTFAVISNFTVIWYNPTYADTYAFKKLLKKNADRLFSFNFHHFLYFFCVTLQKSLTNNAKAFLLLNFAFSGQKREKTIFFWNGQFERLRQKVSPPPVLKIQFPLILHLKAQDLVDNALENFFRNFDSASLGGHVNFSFWALIFDKI
jgi:hypothetical protein